MIEKDKNIIICDKNNKIVILQFIINDLAESI